MSHSFLLMRHAYSRHNREKDSWRKRYNGKSYKELPEYHRTSKFSTELIDSPQVDQEQCKKVRNAHLQFDDIALVICSPLRRCLETCKQVLEGQTSIPVVVEPMLCSRLSAAWSIGCPAPVLQQEYPTFDFGALLDFPYSWMIQLMSHVAELDPEEMVSKGQSMQEYLLDFLVRGYSESYKQFFQRSRQLKERLKATVQKHLESHSQPKSILVIAHSCVLSFLVGSELNEKGKVKDKISFKHCCPRKYSCGEVVSSGKPHPSL